MVVVEPCPLPAVEEDLQSLIAHIIDPNLAATLLQWLNASTPLLALTSTLLAVLLAIHVAFRPLGRWRLRKFGGPRATIPFVGNLPEVLESGGLPFAIASRWHSQHGDVFKTFLGPFPLVVSCDPNNFRPLCREKDRVAFPANQPHPYFPSREDAHELEIDAAGIVFADGEGPAGAYWRGIRPAWASWLGSTEGLRIYAAGMGRAIARARAVFQAHAGRAEPIDAVAAAQNLTLDVVGSAAFGTDLHTQDAPALAMAPVEGVSGGGKAAPSAQGRASDAAETVRNCEEDAEGSGAELVRAARAMFASLGVSARSRSAWAMAAFLLPEAGRLVWTLARTWAWARGRADPTLAESRECRRVLRERALELIRDGAHAPGSWTDKVRGMRDRSRGDGSPNGSPPLSDAQRVSQVRTFLLAGYDTTATMLATLTYLLAAHPGAQARLRREVVAAAASMDDPTDAGEGGGEGGDAPGPGAAAATLSLSQTVSVGVTAMRAVRRLLSLGKAAPEAPPAGAGTGEAHPAPGDGAAGRRRAAAPGLADAAESCPFLDACCKEALRLYPPAPGMVRRVASPGGLQLATGECVPRGTVVLQSTYAIHRDARWWTAPSEFRPERFLGPQPEPRHRDAYTPFGGGARMCPGWRFALLEAKLAVFEMVRAWELGLAEGQGPPRMRSGITLTVAEPIRVTLRPAPEVTPEC